MSIQDKQLTDKELIIELREEGDKYMDIVQKLVNIMQGFRDDELILAGQLKIWLGLKKDDNPHKSKTLDVA